MAEDEAWVAESASAADGSPGGFGCLKRLCKLRVVLDLHT